MLADVVMSLDNVIAVAGMAERATWGWWSWAFSSVPSSSGKPFVLRLMDRFPWSSPGAAFSWDRHGKWQSPPCRRRTFSSPMGWQRWLGTAAAATGALLVVLVGKWLAARQRSPPANRSKSSTLAQPPYRRSEVHRHV